MPDPRVSFTAGQKLFELHWDVLSHETLQFKISIHSEFS